jgi:sporulation protein YlmC with PRC-barrel domain
MIKKIATAAVFGFLTISTVAAQGTARLQASIPGNALTVTDWYKQDVYDPNNAKIGQIMDVLVDKSGKISTLIIGVGGFLGAGEKDVAVRSERSSDNKGQQNPLGDEHEQGRAQECTRIQIRQQHDNLGARQTITDRVGARLRRRDPTPSRNHLSERDWEVKETAGPVRALSSANV